jgi:pimeloyl-ACP methyl ester carboxylesterase
MSIFKTPAGEQAVMAFYDNTLARWPVPYESRTIPTRHGDTHLIVSGEESAPPLILLHGASANALIWIGDVVDYSQHYRVYALDIPGEPGRSEPHYLDWHDATFVEWLADVLDRLAIPRAILVGISQGGWIALKFACHPSGAAGTRRCHPQPGIMASARVRAPAAWSPRNVSPYPPAFWRSTGPGGHRRCDSVDREALQAADEHDTGLCRWRLTASDHAHPADRR